MVMRTSCKHCARLLPQPNQNYNLIIQQSPLRTTWILAEQRSYKWGYKEKTALKLGWFHTHVWQIKIGRDNSGSYPEEGGVQALHWFPQPRASVSGRVIPAKSGWENQQGLGCMRQRAAVDTSVLLKGLHKDLAALNYLASGQGLKGAALSWTKVPADAISSLLNPPHAHLAGTGRCKSDFPLIWLILFSPHSGDSLKPPLHPIHWSAGTSIRD